MNRQAIWAIALKDIRGITANLQVWLPMLIVPLILGVVLPTIYMIAVTYFGPEAADIKEMLVWLDRIPPSPLKDLLDAMPNVGQRVSYLVANYMLAPFFLMIPLMASSVVAADSLAGEKERGTLESLLFAPMDMLSLFTGKVLAAFLPSMVLSLVTFLISTVTVNLTGWRLFGRIFFPALNWLPLMLLVIPMVSLLAIFLTVFISARVATFQAAYQMGGLLVLPALLLLVGQASGLLLLGPGLLTAVGVGLALINLALLWLIVRGLDRNRLFESQIR